MIDNWSGSGVFIAQGVCWSTTPNPTTADNKTIDGIDPDPKHFHSTLTDLNSGTTYYVRAFVTNYAGTSYGNEVSFITPACNDQIVINPNYGSVSDIDGNVYKTVQIGTQTWIAENLKTTRYNNGDKIFLGNGGPAGYTEWFGLGKGAYCWYDNDAEAYKDAYGALYNWHAVGTGYLCPAGWHVPTNSEWTTLVTFLGGQEEAFSEMTENAIIHWESSNNNINISGFTPVNHGELCGWGFLNTDLWWSATPRPTELAVPCAYVVAFRIKGFEPQSYGYSVRCLKD
jgi:uncharacterized protein (TIGR02145 family)